MIASKGYALHFPTDKLAPWDFERREVGEHDVLIEILYCGICHSDIHQARSEWGPAKYPMVPGHEIVGRVKKAGHGVQKFKEGDLAGVGCMVDSCRECKQCSSGYEQFCEKNQTVWTYNSLERDGVTITQGGYSNLIVVDERFVLKVSDKLPLHGVAPLLCAGITTYSPLRRFKIGQGHKVAVVGLGGLGHMGVKFAAAFGAEVTVLSTSPSKKADALKLGAHKFCVTTDKEQTKPLTGYFDFILDTVSAPHNYDLYLDMLRPNGTHICVGIPTESIQFKPFAVIPNKSLGGSSIGGIPETQEMLDYCAGHNIISDVEVIPISYVNEAYERVIKSDVKYRFVIDLSSLG